MGDSARELRVAIKAVETSDAQRYYLRVSAEGEHPALQAAAAGGAGVLAALTDVSDVNARPQFGNNVLHLTLPGGVLSARSELLDAAAFSLRWRLYTLAPAIPAGGGGEALAASGEWRVEPGDAAVLLRGDPRDVKVSLLPEALNGVAGDVAFQACFVDAMAVAAGGSAGQAFGLGARVRSKKVPVKVRVWVACATGVPKAAAAGGGVFVAAKTSREAALRKASKQRTAAAGGDSGNCHWNEVLELEMFDADLDKERVLLALVDADSKQLVAKCAVPMLHLVPRRAYPLKLVLDEAAGTALYLSVTIGEAPRREATILQAAPIQRARVEVSLLEALPPAAGVRAREALELGASVVAVARIEQGGAAAQQAAWAGPLLAPDKLFTRVNVGSGRSDAWDVVADMDHNSDGAGPELMPLLAPDMSSQLWKGRPPQPLTLAPPATSLVGADAALSIELHVVAAVSGVAAGSAGARATPSASSPHQAAPASAAEPAQKSTPADEPAEEPASEPADESEGKPASEAPSAEGVKSLDGPPMPTEESIGMEKASPTKQDAPGTVPSKEGEEAAAPPTPKQPAAQAPEAGGGGSGSGGSDTFLGGLRVPLKGLVAAKAGEPYDLREAHLLGGAGGTLTMQVRHWDDESLMQNVLSDAADGAGTITLTGATLQLAEDVKAKQVLVERMIIQGMERDALAAAAAHSRDVSAVAQQELADELAATQQALADEREAGRATPTLEGVENLTWPELRERAEQLALRHGREQRHNQELVARVHRMHRAAVEHKAESKKYKELQEAHAQQGRVVARLEREAGTARKCRETITSQERVIARLESLLEESAGDSDALSAARAESRALAEDLSAMRRERDGLFEEVARAKSDASAQLERLRSDSGVVELETANREKAAELAAVREASKAADENSKKLEEEKMAMMMRCEIAEARAVASTNELVEATQRYAKEISVLKAKLAEKEAQLMGGFGSLANLALGEMPRVVPFPRGSTPPGRKSPGALKPLDGADAKPTPPSTRKPAGRAGGRGAAARARRGG